MSNYNDAPFNDTPFNDSFTRPPARPKSDRRLLIWGLVGCFGFFLIFAAIIGTAGYFGVRTARSTRLADAGAVAYEAGNYEKAVEHFDRALEINPTYQDALFLRADALRQLGEYDRAMEDCNRLIKANPGYEGAYNLRGLVHDAQGDSENALADFLKALEVSKDDPIILSNIALTYSDMEDYDKALVYINLAVAQAPTELHYSYDRGMILFHMENYRAALPDFERCVRSGRPISNAGVFVTPEEITQYYVSCLIELERFDELERFERQAIVKDPMNAATYRDLNGTYLMQKKFDESEKLLDEALSRVMDADERHSLYRSWAYRFAFQEDDQAKQRALKIAKKFVAETGGNVDSLTLLANIHEFSQQWEEAIDVYTQLIEQDPQYLLIRAACYRKAGEYEKAMADFDTLERSGEPLDSEFYRELAFTYEATEDFEKAVENMTKCIEKSHEEGENDYYICDDYSQRGRYREKLGDVEQAETDFDHAVASDEECETCRQMRAEFYLRQDRPEGALRDLNMLIAEREEYIEEYSLYNDGKLYALRAEAYDKLNEPEKAEADRKKAAELKAAYEEEWGPIEEEDEL